MHKSVLLTIACILISLLSLAQPPVDIWQVQTPTNPMNCTNTTVTVTGWNDASNYILQPITFSYGNDTIWIDIKYVSPQIVLGVLTSWSHTVTLGNVPYGNWTVAARGYLGGAWQSEAYGWLPVGACCPTSIPQFDFVQDTVCAGAPISVSNNSIGNNLTYLWEYEGGSSTAASPTFSIAEAGAYDVTLTVTGDSCSDSLVKEIEVLAQPEVNLGNDTTVCDGDTLVLILPTGDDYLWSDGSTSFENSIAAIGTLSVTVTNDDGCVGSDTIAVTGVLPTITVNLGADKMVCPEEVVSLNAGSGGTSYLWSTGESTQMVDVNQEGTYSVTVSESGSCDGNDEIQVSWYEVDEAEIELSQDSCAERLISLDPSTHTVISWDNASTDSSIIVILSDYYFVTATDQNDCETTDSVWVNIVDNPIVDLGPDTFLCGNQTITLTTGISGAHLWKDGSTGIAFTVTQKGKYSVTVVDQNGCTGADTIKVSDCLGLNELSANDLVLYPNPASNFIHVSGTNGGSYKIFDAAGRVVQEVLFFENQVDVTRINEGVYFIEFSDYPTRTNRFIKQ